MTLKGAFSTLSICEKIIIMCKNKALKIHKALMFLIAVIMLSLFVEWKIHEKGWYKVTDVYNTGSRTSKMIQKYEKKTVVYVPEIDLVESNDKYIIKCDLPGVDVSGINILIAGNCVRISGKKGLEENEEKNAYCYMERKKGVFNLDILLTGPIVKEVAEVQYDNGILIIEVQKDRSNNQRES